MSPQGKQFTPEMVELVIHLKEHYDAERKAGHAVSTQNPARRTANSLGIGLATVKRIMALYARSGGQIVSLPAQHPGRPPVGLSQNMQPVVRQFVRDENLHGRRVSLDRLRNFLIAEHEATIPRMTLWRAVKRWGFTHGEGRRRSSLKEKEQVILARRRYLRIKCANRKVDGTLRRPEVYLDETYVNRNHSSRFTWYLDEDGPWVNKPAGVGQRFIVVHAITQEGWVPGAQLVFEAKKRTGDYHGQMNWENFSRWFCEQLLPNIPEGAVLVLDNASYHNVLAAQSFPKPSTKKEELIAWLRHNDYPWREDMLKSELLAFCRRLAPAPQYRLDELATARRVSILRVPPYHPELQPIETCWAVMKNYLADRCDFTMAGLREKLPEAFAQVTAATLREIIQKVVAQEDRYWREDEKLDDAYAKNEEEEEWGTKLRQIESVQRQSE
jgi:transposase